MSRHTKFSDDEVMDYIRGWYDDEGWSDLNLMIDRNLICLAIDTILSSGAIDPGQCYKEYKDIETYITEYKYTKKEIEDEREEFWKDVEVWIDEQSNEHAFCHTDGYCGVDSEELVNLGFKLDQGYDSEGKQYTKTRI